MSETPYKDMEFREVCTEQTGRALMQLGEGTSLRYIIFEAMRVALYWKAERDKALKEQETAEKKP